MRNLEDNLLNETKLEINNLISRAENSSLDTKGDIYSSATYLGFLTKLENERKLALNLADKVYSGFISGKDKIYSKFYSDRKEFLNYFFNRERKSFPFLDEDESLSEDSEEFLEDLRKNINPKLLKKIDNQERYLSLLDIEWGCEEYSKERYSIEDIKEFSDECKEKINKKYPFIREAVLTKYNAIVHRDHGVNFIGKDSDWINELYMDIRKDLKYLQKFSGINFINGEIIKKIEEFSLEDNWYSNFGSLGNGLKRINNILSLVPENQRDLILNEVPQKAINCVYAEAIENFAKQYARPIDKYPFEFVISHLKNIRRTFKKSPEMGVELQKAYTFFDKYIKMDGKFVSQDGPYRYYIERPENLINARNKIFQLILEK